MKLLVFLFIIGAVGSTYISCTKAKPPYASLDCSDTISFAEDIQPLINNNCISCHDLGNSTGYTFTDHGGIADNANIMLSAMRAEGVELMPQGGPQLPDSVINLFQCWMQNGKLDN